MLLTLSRDSRYRAPGYACAVIVEYGLSLRSQLHRSLIRLGLIFPCRPWCSLRTSLQSLCFERSAVSWIRTCYGDRRSWLQAAKQKRLRVGEYSVMLGE